MIKKEKKCLKEGSDDDEKKINLMKSVTIRFELAKVVKVNFHSKLQNAPVLSYSCTSLSLRVFHSSCSYFENITQVIEKLFSTHIQNGFYEIIQKCAPN